LGFEVEEIPVESVGSGKAGKWDYAGLADGLKATYPKPKAGEQKGGRVKMEKVYEYHSDKGETIDKQHKGHYAKLAIKKAIGRCGWKPIKVAQNGDYIEFVIEF